MKVKLVPFVSVDGEVKRVAHTSGVVEMIGAEPVGLPVLDPETGLGHKGLQECAMAAGCIPYKGADPEIVAAELAEKERAAKEIFDKAVDDAVAAKLAELGAGAPNATTTTQPVTEITATVTTAVAETAPAPAQEAPAAESAPVLKGKLVKP